MKRSATSDLAKLRQLLESLGNLEVQIQGAPLTESTRTSVLKALREEIYLKVLVETDAVNPSGELPKA